MMKVFKSILLLLLLSFFTLQVSAQHPAPVWSAFPALPDSLGFAGMFAGVIADKVFCMGGANFPGAKPWEGGQKRWHDRIFVLQNGEWSQLKKKLPIPLGYGVSISYQNKIILIGGSNQNGHTNQVIAISWKDNSLRMEPYPDLPFPLANMSGAVVNNMIIVSGGSVSPVSSPLKKCLALNLEDLKTGWFELNPWPGPERLFPVSAAHNGKYYLFSGETTTVSADGQKQRRILQDAYTLTLCQAAGKWHGTWKRIPDMPKGVSAGPSPAPYLKKHGFVFWGGVDGVTALYKDPKTHPGINSEIIAFDPATEIWSTRKQTEDLPARVTLPVVAWKGKWIFISGEIKPGIRTQTVYGLE